MKYVLFVCTHNAGRSQMAQAFFERHAPADVRAESAGSEPADRVHPVVVEAMREIGIDLADRRPKKLTLEMQLHADWAITLACGARLPVRALDGRGLGHRRPGGQADRGGARHPRRDRGTASRTWSRTASTRSARTAPATSCGCSGCCRTSSSEFAGVRLRCRDPRLRRRDPRRLPRCAGAVVRHDARAPPHPRVPGSGALRAARARVAMPYAEPPRPDVLRRAAAEGLAAFALVFAGCGAIVAERAVRRRARCRRRQPRVRADHHGDGLRDRPPVRRAHQPCRDGRVHPHAGTSRLATPPPTSRRSSPGPPRARSLLLAVWPDQPADLGATVPSVGRAARSSTSSC